MSSGDEVKMIPLRDRAAYEVFRTYKFNYGATKWPAEPEAQVKLNAKLVQQWLNFPNEVKQNYRGIYKDQKTPLAATGDEEYDRLVKEHFQPAANPTKTNGNEKNATFTPKAIPNSAEGSTKPNGLRMPETGFFLYKREKKAEIQKKLADGDGPKDAMQMAMMAGKMWGEESEAVKLEYNKRCKPAVDKYNAAKKAEEIKKKYLNAPKVPGNPLVVDHKSLPTGGDDDYDRLVKEQFEQVTNPTANGKTTNPTANVASVSNELRMPVTGFLLYKREKTAEIQKNLAGGDGPKDAKQIALIAGEMKRKESEAVKLDYKKRCKPDLDAYNAAKKVADETKKKDPNAPKEPLTTFLRFYQANRAKHADGVKSSNEIARRVGVEWKTMTEEEKLVYLQALKDSHPPNVFERFCSANRDEVGDNLIELRIKWDRLASEEKQKYQESAKSDWDKFTKFIPKALWRSDYSRYYDEEKKKFVGLHDSEKRKILSAKWKLMSTGEKKPFVDACMADNELLVWILMGTSGGPRKFVLQDDKNNVASGEALAAVAMDQEPSTSGGLVGFQNEDEFMEESTSSSGTPVAENESEFGALRGAFAEVNDFQ